MQDKQMNEKFSRESLPHNLIGNLSPKSSIFNKMLDVIYFILKQRYLIYQDRRLHVGDQLLAVNGHSLVGLEQVEVTLDN